MEREEAIQILADLIDNPFLHTWEKQNKALDMAIEALQNLSKPNNGLQGLDLISRQDAIDAFGLSEKTRKYGGDHSGYDTMMLYEIQDVLESLPSTDRPTTDCTEFMEWIKAEVLDENNWELNAVAYGEIICRKLKKLGWIDVEDGFYVDTRPTGEWVYQESENIEKIYLCSNCKNYEAWGETEKTPYCPNCGARMLGEDGEA